MKLTIVIVCFNGENYIDETLNSLVSQTYSDYEVVVVDGVSSDNSLKKFEKFRGKIKNLKIISEPDKGIYDAMNKGVKLANGEYIYFLNLGDRLFDEFVLERMVEEFSSNKVFYYGNAMFGDRIRKFPKRLNDLFFLMEFMVCHQTIFAKRESLLNFPFNLEFKYCADRDWIVNILKNGATYKHIDYIIAYYDLTGVSSQLENFQEDSLKLIYKQWGKKGVFFVKTKRKVGKLLKTCFFNKG